jgi:hypothetical protein
MRTRIRSAHQVHEHLAGYRDSYATGGPTWPSVSVPYRVAASRTSVVVTADGTTNGGSETATRSLLRDDLASQTILAQSVAAIVRPRRLVSAACTTFGGSNTAMSAGLSRSATPVEGARYRDVTGRTTPRASATCTTAVGGRQVARETSIHCVITVARTSPTSARTFGLAEFEVRRVVAGASTVVLRHSTGRIAMAHRACDGSATLTGGCARTHRTLTTTIPAASPVISATTLRVVTTEGSGSGGDSRW